MARRIDGQRRRDWESRLSRYRSSGLTVCRFCENENVSVNRFYYWSKRLVSKSSSARLADRDSAQAAATRTHPASAKPQSLPQLPQRSLAPAAQSAGMVHFLLSASVQVSIPADCLEAIRCLAECVQRSSNEQPNAFQRVIVGTQRKAL